MFNEKVTDFEIDKQNKQITGVICSKLIKTNTVILAIGHSSRRYF